MRVCACVCVCVRVRACVVCMHQDFEPVEQCHLDYRPDRGAAIDMHFDDSWYKLTGTHTYTHTHTRTQRHMKKGKIERVLAD